MVVRAGGLFRYGVSVPSHPYTLITGGAGFIGTNLADALASMGRRVVLFDNLSRAGVEGNLRWLRGTHGNKVQLVRGDIRDRAAVRDAVRGATQVFHFAAQTAVTTGLVDPRADFETNAAGTFNVLDALHKEGNPAPVLLASTNKVYGGLDDIELEKSGWRYQPVDAKILAHGVNEDRPLAFRTPYGCSKGAADQYVLDFARSFGHRAVVFRMSCVYGPHQCGTEDQGWIAHFIIRALADQPITIYGNGLQVRDVLFADDLVNAMLLAEEHMDEISGQAFNIGGGVANTLSLMELLGLVGKLHPTLSRLLYDRARSGDQKYYVSDTRRFARATGWEPQTGVIEGLKRIYAWMRETRAPMLEPTEAVVCQ